METLKKVTPNKEDVADHLSTIFTENRLKNI